MVIIGTSVIFFGTTLSNKTKIGMQLCRDNVTQAPSRSGVKTLLRALVLYVALIICRWHHTSLHDAAASRIQNVEVLYLGQSQQANQRLRS